MSKVEELREKLEVAIFHVEDNESMHFAIGMLDPLIAAAREEGKNELQAIFDMLWKRMRTWEEEWRSENPKERALTSPDSIQLMEWKIAKARAEGAEQERERIRNGSKYDDYHDDERWCGRPDGDPAKAFWTVPAFLLSPAPKEEPNYYAVGDKGESGEAHT